MSDLLKVFMLLDSLAPGGTEQSSVALAPRVRSLGVDLTIVTLKPARHELDATAIAAGVPVIRLGAGSVLRQIRELRRLLREQRPDVLHTALFRADQVGRLAASGTGVRVLASFVNTPYDAARLGDPNVVRWKLRTLQSMDAVTGRALVHHFLSVSDGTKTANALALRVSLSKVSVAERGRDVAALGQPGPVRRSAVRAGLGVADRAEVVLNLGRQEFQKGHAVLIDAVCRLATDHPDLVALVAGKEGSASAAIAAALEAARPTSRAVRLLGHRTDIGDLLAAADLLVISSHFEGTAGVALEAMAMGTPIVSTDLDGLRGVLEHGENAWLVPTGDAEALAAGIEHVLGDRALAARLAERGRRDFAERFTLEAAARRLADLYAEVAARA